MKKIRNSITALTRAALLTTALLVTSLPTLPAAADEDPEEYPTDASPVGIDPSGQPLEWAPDAAEAAAPSDSEESIPGYKPESIESAGTTSLGAQDGRVHFTDTTAYPNSAIVYISKDGKPFCTGWMVSADTLVTAGHCVYNYDREEWLSDLEYSPGANGPERPFETATAVQTWTDVSWVKKENPLLDWGLVKLDKRLGERTGWFGLAWRSGEYTDTQTELRGYPADKDQGELWGMSGKVERSQGNQLCYSMDTYPAQSGSPLYMADGAFVIGIHAYGKAQTRFTRRECSPNYNAGTRITKGLFELILDLRSRADTE